MLFCKPVHFLMVVLGLGTFSASAQETAYAFSTKCFTPRIYGFTVQMTIRSDAPRECRDEAGQALSPKAVSIVSTKDVTDAKLTELKRQADDSVATAIAAIKESVAENSVKAGDIDSAVKSIEQKLYENILRRVKADLAAQANRPAGARQ